MSSVRERVILLLSNVLESQEIGLYLQDNCDITQIGLDSIKFIKLIVSIEESFDIEFSEDDLDFSKYKSIELLCKHIDDCITSKNSEEGFQ